MTVHVYMNLGDTDGCCGVTQLRDFSTTYGTHQHGDINATGATAAEAYQNLLNAVMVRDFEDSDFNCAVVQVWFFKGHDYRGVDNPTYEAEELRLLVEAIPNVRNLGEYRNPNTNNLIQGYQWEVR